MDYVLTHVGLEVVVSYICEGVDGDGWGWMDGDGWSLSLLCRGGWMGGGT